MFQVCFSDTLITDNNTQDWKWRFKHNLPEVEISKTITDSQLNVLTCGTFVLPAQTARTIFLYKISPTGKLLWEHYIRASNGVIRSCAGLTTNSEQTIFLLGQFEGIIDVGTAVLFSDYGTGINTFVVAYQRRGNDPTTGRDVYRTLFSLVLGIVPPSEIDQIDLNDPPRIRGTEILLVKRAGSSEEQLAILGDTRGKIHWFNGKISGSRMMDWDEIFFAILHPSQGTTLLSNLSLKLKHKTLELDEVEIETTQMIELT